VHCSSWKKCKIWMSCLTESPKLLDMLLVKCLPISGDNLNNVLMYVVPLALRSAEHISKLCKVQSLEMYRFLWYTSWLKIYTVLFYWYFLLSVMFSSSSESPNIKYIIWKKRKISGLWRKCYLRGFWISSTPINIFVPPVLATRYENIEFRIYSIIANNHSV